MGTLGQYLSSAREQKGLDLHDAAQQTRIGIQYLKALEKEDFSKLPGEVFVRGFLKGYAKFLGLPEQEVLKKYGEFQHAAAGRTGAAPQPVAAEQAPALKTPEKPSKVSLEPWIWGTAMFVSILGFLFMATPEKQPEPVEPLNAHTSVLMQSAMTGSAPAIRLEKLYLQIVALEDVWLLVRTDSGPQKKAVLKKDENVVWSADERFLLSYGSVGAAKLLLNGEELTVTGQKSAVVRDLEITASGITSAKAAPVLPRVSKPRLQPEPRREPAAVQTTETPQPAPQPQAEATAPAPENPASMPAPVVSPQPSSLP